jgi:YbbR domain-containing protein
MPLPGFLTRNLRAKALATGIALVTWVGVVYAGNPPESRTVNVHVPQDPASLPSKFVLAVPVPDISVRVSGTREHVNAFSTSNLAVTVDYTKIKTTGMHDIPIRLVNNDRDVSLDNVPDTITVDVDQTDSVRLPVTIVLDATPPTGYVITGQRVNPDSVVVTGPHRRLIGLSAQVHLDMANQKTNLEGQYDVLVFDRFGRKVGDLGVTTGQVTEGVTKAQVTVSMTVSSVTTSRSSAVVPKVTGTPLPGHYLVGISASPLTVVLTGPQELLNGLDSISTAAISLSGLATGDHVFPVKVTPPAGVTATPDTVTLTITIAVLATPSPAPPSPTPTPTPTPSPPPPTP